MDNIDTYLDEIREEAKKLSDEELKDLSDRVAIQSKLIVALSGRVEDLEERVKELEDSDSSTGVRDDDNNSDSTGGYFET